ncbi:hypothetical protein FXF51_07450 [Nonomuraea sp. PA05]|uniref:hypothetical protein n=1 Tax=Nonomuraea sp. PA05 TaxID=2604466 RepID=UPI0011D921E8|nr:hypothetical protein [Nonomuraea sp. PA05]TYB69973.1 hypothetical protein FXF51_07450 [Nonomuraea sp. PA05]
MIAESGRYDVDGNAGVNLGLVQIHVRPAKIEQIAATNACVSGQRELGPFSGVVGQQLVYEHDVSEGLAEHYVDVLVGVRGEWPPFLPPLVSRS